MEGQRREKIAPACYAAVIVTVLAPLLGGSTRLWAQAAITACVGAVFLLFPPGKSLGLVPNLASFVLLLLAGAAFLPASWFSTPEFRIELGKIGVQLPVTVSAQPWLTLQSSLLFLLCLSWAYFLLSADWSLPERHRSWFLIGTAITVLAAMLTISFVLGKPIPFWPNAEEFGFFPNRNHTSNVLGLGGILVYALALDGFKQRRSFWWIWLGPLALICWALIENYSRAGVILILAGALTWHLSWLITSRNRRLPLIALGMIILLLALFAWNGGKTAMRFGHETTDFFFPSQNTRLLIYRDAINLSLRGPIVGIGLGNFSPVFTTQRHDFLDISFAGHPESDWLLSAVELGWLAPLLIGVLVGWWARHCFLFEHGTLRLMRLAAFIAVGGFALHAFFDVPGHRIGALWPALFLASTALNPKVGYHQSRTTSIVFRLLGIFFIAAGIWWFTSILGTKVLPTAATVSRSFRDIESARVKEDYQTMLERASKTLEIAPLNWELYFKRGFAEAAMHHPSSETLRDFAAARYLLPNWPELYLKEGLVWLDFDQPDLAFDVWEEGMRRLPQNAAVIYSDIFAAIRDDAGLRDRWRELADGNKKCLLVFLQNAEPFEFQIELRQLLAEDQSRNDRSSRNRSGLQSFTPDELKTLFTFWYKKGDKLWLAQTLQEHPEWKKIAWPQLARVYSDYEDYRQAFEIADQFLPQKDNTESSSPTESPLELALRFRNNPADPGAGEALARALAREGKIDGALLTLRAVRALPGSPKYLPALEARLWAKKQDWKRAWNAVAPLVSAQE